ncbi:hypothetical protein P2G88_01925 [Aliiglaciecola sp. CAU 1673]|uniref:hypothetical protein n=1 Tax=Aliiglaciecola sp. CAU 1673 TaxID=3032595 RepID=UPI0023D9949B|nr:hypothetical protein [Aliiglaciecola sp. CAU 1673]MDF2177011.1 hypothetical protein [Aliiglaciecola sp. CAU 1673]
MPDPVNNSGLSSVLAQYQQASSQQTSTQKSQDTTLQTATATPSTADTVTISDEAMQLQGSSDGNGGKPK